MKRLFTIGAIMLCGHIAGMSSAQAGDNSSHSVEMPKGRSVGDFLSPDGRIDLDAARQADFEGSLDLDGFDVTLDPATGEPRLRPEASASAPDDEYWHGSLGDIAINGTINSLTVYGSELIAGGGFTTVGGVAASHIARWNGSVWRPLGSGMSSDVLTLTVYNGYLIAGGSFTTAGEVAANCIARWNGLAWQTIGTGMNDDVYSLTVYNNELIAGGRFTTAGGWSANHIARSNGSQWATLGSGMNGVVLSLTVYNNELIAGGNFTTAGGVAANRIARWNGSTWQPLGSGMSRFVWSLAVYNG